LNCIKHSWVIGPILAKQICEIGLSFSSQVYIYIQLDIYIYISQQSAVVRFLVLLTLTGASAAGNESQLLGCPVFLYTPYDWVFMLPKTVMI
jgi:hypothetical protein